MVIEVIAAEIGERGGLHRQPFVAILRQAVARRFIGDMRHPFARQPTHVGKKCHDIGRGEPGRDTAVRCGDAERADRGCALTAHAPDLAGHLDSRGFAVGASDGNHMFGHRGEESCRQPGEGATRLVSGDVNRAFDMHLIACHNCHCPGSYRVGDDCFGVEARAAKSSKHRARCHLAMIDGKSGNGDVMAFAQSNPRLLGQPAQLHATGSTLGCASGTSGIRSLMSTSRVVSGCTPRIGPIRGTSRPTIGAAFQAAVR